MNITITLLNTRSTNPFSSKCTRIITFLIKTNVQNISEIRFVRTYFCNTIFFLIPLLIVPIHFLLSLKINTGRIQCYVQTDVKQLHLLFYAL